MAQQLTTEILNAALENLTAKRQQIDEQIAEVRRMLGGRNGAVSPAVDGAPKRKMSAAGREAIAEAQRRRWAAKKADVGSASPSKSEKPKRKLSAEGRRNIVAALKKRWAAKRSAAAKTPVAKKATAKRAKPKAPASSVAGGSNS